MNYIDSKYARIRSYMTEHGLDAVYVSSPENYLYYSGYQNPDGFMVITQSKSYVFADFRYIEAAKKSVYPNCEICLQGEVGASDILDKESVTRMGFEDEAVTMSEYNKLTGKISKDACRELFPMGEALVRLRAVKYPEEIDCIVKAQRIAEKAFQHILSVINYNMTEIEAAAEIEYYMKKNGSEGPSFDTIAVSGSASSVPHGTPRNVKLERGFLTLDFGAKFGGYCSDMTRTIVIGKADEDMKRLYNTVLSAQLSAIDYLKAGGRGCSQADKVARDVIDGAGYEGRFGHSLGHGVGLYIHERPNLSRLAEKELLSPGNIVTVEPGIYIEGKYGCRIEDMALITEDGANILTDCPKTLIEI